MRTIPFIFIIILLLSPFQGVSQNASGQYLSPSMRAGEYLGSVDLPNFTIELGALDFGINLNFTAGEILKGDQTANLKNLSQNRDYLIIHNNFRGYGFGGKILEYANNIIKENGFLLCEHKNIYFYKKYGWNINNDITIINKEYSDNLSKMIFNNLSSNVNYN